MLKLTEYSDGQVTVVTISPRNNEGVFTERDEVTGRFKSRYYVADVIEGTPSNLIHQRAWIAQGDQPSREEPCL